MRYLDTSAIVPLLITEPGSERCRALLTPPTSIASSMITLVETAAALARAERMRRITGEDHKSARHELDMLWDSITPVPVTEPVVQFACELTRRYGLRGYDAVQCASALALADEPDLTAASGDRALLEAWSDLGLYTIDVSGEQ